MMRALFLIPLVALAACSENYGWNPNYRAEATPYGDYLRAREVALTGKVAEPPREIPVALPAKAPTAVEIASPDQLKRMSKDAYQAQARATVAQPVRNATPAVDPTRPVVTTTRTTVAAPQGGRYPRDGSVIGNCASWGSAELAQKAFIAQGGPQRDPLGLDPDGDGIVCGWQGPANPL